MCVWLGDLSSHPNVKLEGRMPKVDAYDLALGVQTNGWVELASHASEGGAQLHMQGQAQYETHAQAWDDVEACLVRDSEAPVGGKG